MTILEALAIGSIAAVLLALFMLVLIGSQAFAAWLEDYWRQT